MIPTERSAIAAAALIAVAILPAILGSELWAVWAGALAALVLLMVLDLLLIPRREAIAFEVAHPAVLGVGERGALRIAVTARGAPPRVAAVVLPEVGAMLVPMAETALAPGAGACELPLVARRRGVATIAAIWLRMTGPLGLVRKQIRHDLGGTLTVLPDTRPVRRAALQAVNRRDAQSGANAMRYVGEGSNFAALREFLPGHDHRAISWRASARHNKLLCREFNAERDQPVVLAFDTGHLMCEPLDGVTRLDHAIAGALLLAWSCLRGGDRVGLYAFGARPGGFRATSGGPGTFAAIEQWTSHLDYGVDETNYTLGLSELARRLRRRSLVVLFTDFVDVVAAKLMLENVARLVERHVVLFVTLADPAPRDIAATRPGGIGDVHKAVVAAQFQKEREGVLSRLRRLGVHVIDGEPRELQRDLVQRYLWIKRREIL